MNKSALGNNWYRSLMNKNVNMNPDWYRKIVDAKNWQDKTIAINERRDSVIKLAVSAAESKGHKLASFSIGNITQCLKCSKYVQLTNVHSPTHSPDDFFGDAIDNQCDVVFEGNPDPKGTPDDARLFS